VGGRTYDGLPRRLRLAGIAAMSLALCTAGRASSPSDSSHWRAGDTAGVTMVADAAQCRAGFVEEVLAGWLESAKDSDFASEYVAKAFDQLVELVVVLHDFAQDLCL
jgi:hypothetical protein